VTWIATSRIIVMSRTRDTQDQVELSPIRFVFATNHLPPTVCKAYNLGKTIDTSENKLRSRMDDCFCMDRALTFRTFHQ
jgi:hypothetical protein